MNRAATFLLAGVLATAACGGGDTNGDADPGVDSGAGIPAHPKDAGTKPPADATVPPNPGHSDAGSQAQGGKDGGAPVSSSDAGGATADAAPTKPAHFDVTFYVMADSHADPVPEDDLLAQSHAIDSVAQSGQWPAQIGGTPTGFLGGSIAAPRGVVVCGDITGWGTAPTELPMFRSYFEMGNSASSIHYPAYVGLGNQYIDTADRDDATATAYRATYWSYIDSRYQGPSAPIPVTNYDSASHSYSWDWGGVHLVMLHRFAGDTEYGLPSALPFLKSDLAAHASDGRPVFLFHHYGMDAFGTNGQWWSQTDRDAYRAELTGYHVSGDFTGHTHYAMQYSWAGLRVFQANNAKAEIDAGNNDGNGSFAIVRVTDTQLDVVTCRWTDDHGGYELIGPFFSGPSDVGAAPSP
ncbi:MAG TPA: hypothetical protein VGI39_17315 [Polyangiaceae bacterium]|jgi:cytolysin (calcineurin-like family phosphatase)